MGTTADADSAGSLLAALGEHGYGHFTTMRIEAGGVRGLAHHLERLRRDGLVLFGHAPDPAEVRTILAAHEPPAGHVVRLTHTTSRLDLADPAASEPPRLVVTSRPAPDVGGDLTVLPLAHERYLPEVKHAALLPLWHLRRAARASGHDDAVLVDRAGHLSEGPTWSLVLAAGDTLVLPRAPRLSGVTEQLLVELAARRGLAVRRADVTTELAGIDAAYAANAVWGVRRIAAVGDRVLGRSAELESLADAYRALPPEPLEDLP